MESILYIVGLICLALYTSTKDTNGAIANAIRSAFEGARPTSLRQPDK